MPNPISDKDSPVWQRILNSVVLVLIGLAVYAQVLQQIRYVINPLGMTIPDEALPDMLNMTIIPGTLLALGKLIWHFTRTFRETGTLRYVLVYGAIVALPFALSAWTGSASHGAQPVDAVMEPAHSDESAQYVAGATWAKQNVPVNRNACHGDFEFIRGCWQQVDDRINGQYRAGQDWARDNKPVRAALCQGTPHFVMGCRTYFDEHLRPPRPDGLDKYTGMTTAECIEDVQGSIDALRNVDMEDGDVQKFADAYRRHWMPLLRDCDNYDIVATMKWMPAAYDRVTAAIDKFKNGQVVSDDEHAAILKDFTDMSAVRDQPYKTSYMERFDEYTKRRAGEFQEPVIVYPTISCSEYQAKINDMKALDKQRTDEMDSLRRPGGVVIDTARYSELNKERIAMLNDWALYAEGAKKNHCWDAPP